MNKKKAIKIIGNIITIIVVIFIIKRLISFEIDWMMLFTPKNLLILSILIIAYSINVIFICIPWNTILEIMTSIKIKFADLVLVSCKANVLKYIPGNVFQYVGRNEIAVKMKFNHFVVGVSTIIDVLINVISIFFISLIFYYPGFKIWIETFGISSLKFIITIFIIFALIGILIFLSFKKKFINYFKKYKILFEKQNVKSILFCFLYYSIQGIYTSFIYIIILQHIIGVHISIEKMNIIIGAFLLSWIMGFVMVGAPAGIGIREATMVLLTNNILPSETILLSMVIYRIITTLGDVVALIIAKLINIKSNQSMNLL